MRRQPFILKFLLEGKAAVLPFLFNFCHHFLGSKSQLQVELQKQQVLPREEHLCRLQLQRQQRLYHAASLCWKQQGHFSFNSPSFRQLVSQVASKAAILCLLADCCTASSHLLEAARHLIASLAQLSFELQKQQVLPQKSLCRLQLQRQQRLYLLQVFLEGFKGSGSCHFSSISAIISWQHSSASSLASKAASSSLIRASLIGSSCSGSSSFICCKFVLEGFKGSGSCHFSSISAIISCGG